MEQKSQPEVCNSRNAAAFLADLVTDNIFNLESHSGGCTITVNAHRLHELYHLRTGFEQEDACNQSSIHSTDPTERL